MTPEFWQRICAVIETTEGTAPKERLSALRDECDGDDELEKAVLALLATMENCPTGFLPLQAAEEQMPGATNGGPGTDSGGFVPGKRIGRFVLLGELGRGATGIVFAAEQTDIRRKVALKVIPTMLLSEQSVRRIRREGDLAGRLRHPAIATVYEHGSDSDFHWIAMEWVDGRDLRRELEHCDRGDTSILPQSGDPRRVVTIVELICQIAEGLETAHVARIVHRDIKPANILLTKEGAPKLADFGVARAIDEPSTTKAGEVAGTPYYMSPEQVGGVEVDARTDIYSLGAVLFVLLTRRVPFPGSNEMEITGRILRDPTPGIRELDSSLPLDLEAVCQKAMAKGRGDRYASAAEFAADLRRFLRFEAVVAARPTAWSIVRRFGRRHGRKVFAVGAALLIVGLVAIWSEQSVIAGRRASLEQELAGFEARATEAIDAGGGASLRDLGIAFSAAEARLETGGSALRERTRALRQRLDVQGGERARLGETHIERVFSSAVELTPVDQRALLEGVRFFEEASALMPGRADVEAKARPSTWFPELSIDTNPSGAKVTLQPVEWLSGEFDSAVPLRERTPLRRVKTPPGRYRITLEIEGYGFVEITRWLGEMNRHYELGTFSMPRRAEVLRDMVFHSRSEQTVVVPIPDPRTSGSVRKAFPHAPFYLDRCEVSNSEYVRFLAAAGDTTMRPSEWAPKAEDPAWLGRPVVGVSWHQARAYAEWVGKRLPTEVEWMRAALGEERRKFPWGSDESFLTGVVVARHELKRSEKEQRNALYLRFTVPVDRSGVDRTPEGVLHLAGNVSEWTDSVGVGALDGRMYPLYSHRRSKGWNWTARRPRTLLQYEEFQISFPQGAPIRGFRCATSAAPNQKR